MAANGQVGAIELQDKSCPVDSLVFFLHHVREDFKIFLVARVELVFEKQRYDPWRCRGHERFAWPLSDQGAFKTGNVLVKRLLVPPPNRATAARGFQGHHSLGFRDEALNEFRKIAKVTGGGKRTDLPLSFSSTRS